MKHNPIDKAMLLLVVTVVLVLALLNVCQTDRPTVSETENRNLATMPEFSVSTLLDGSYFSDFSKFFSDTFFGRETMVNLSKKMDRLKSLSIFYSDEDDFSVIVDPNATMPPLTQGTLPTLPPLPPLTQPTQPPTTTSPFIPTFPTHPTDPDNPTNPTTPTQPVIPLLLSDKSANIVAGATHVLTAQVGKGYGMLTWKSSDPNVATVAPNGSTSATISGVKAGTAEISATVTHTSGETYTLVCTVTVTEPVIEKPDDVADFLPNGLIIYKGAAYSQSWFAGEQTAKSFASVYERYAQLFPDATVSVVPAPLATITITDPNISKNISDQGWILDQMEKYMPGSVNFVNLKDVYKAHTGEYLYYRSDHHWTHRGAYYAYAEFVRSRGMEFGLKPYNAQQLKIDLQRRHFDFVLGSVHHVDELDIYFEPYWRGKTVEQAVERYLQETLACVKAHEDFDVLGHLTYISKARGNPSHKLLRYEDYRELFDAILMELVRHDKGMEVNTSGIDRCGGPLPTMDFVRRFHELGGKIITVGSDAHNAQRVGQYSNEMVQQVKEIFGYVCTFENRQPIFHK